MRILPACLVILCISLASQALADDAHLTYDITNQGSPLPTAWFAVHKPGQKQSYLKYERSGRALTIPAGTYDIAIHYEADAVKIIKWLPGQTLSGEKRENFELGEPVTELCLTITNGGTDLGRKGWYALHKSKTENYIHYDYSGQCFLAPSGTYDVALHFEDDKVKNIKWLDQEKIEGPKLEKTVELGMPVTHAKYTVTNGGEAVGRKATWAIYKPGDHSRYIAYDYSGEQMTIDSGTYDIGIDFTEGETHEVRWLENQVLQGEVNQSYELGMTLASVKINVTNKGVDVGRKAWWAVYDRGERGNYLAYKYAGETMTVPEGTYDLSVRFEDGAVKIIRWLSDTELKGKVEQTVELAAGMADLTVKVTRRGEPLEKAWCGAYKSRKSGVYDAYAYSEKPMRILTGIYDIGCFYGEKNFTSEKWLEKQEINADTQLSVELDQMPATLTVKSGKTVSGASSGAAADTAVNLSLILDASGSMAAKVEDKKNRLEVAKEVLSGVIDSLPKNVQVELQVYGTAPKAKVDCRDTKVLSPLGPVNKAALKEAFSSLNPSGYTPIAYSLERAAASLPKGANNSLILVTDGIESCGGDPCAEAARLSAEGLLARSFVVGFGLDLDKSQFLSCIGRYYPANDRKALQSALKEVISESLKPMKGHVSVYRPGERKEIVVQGSLDEKLLLAAGTYDVLIQAGGKELTWSAIKIEGNLEKSL